MFDHIFHSQSPRSAAVQALCLSFEAAWEGGARPRIEDLVTRLPQNDLSRGLQELIALEVALRWSRDEQVTAEEYHARFPGHPEEVDSAFAAVQGNQQASYVLPDRYAYESTVGRGGMGDVIRVRDRQFDRALALKMVRADRCGSRELLARFRNEARVTALMQHPGVPPVHETGTLAGGVPYFTMKLVEGETLSSILQRRTSPGQELDRLLGVFEQVAQTIAFAHQLQIVHRDLKPQNIMVGRFGEVQVMDWGLAKLRTDDSPATPGTANSDPGAAALFSGSELPDASLASTVRVAAETDGRDTGDEEPLRTLAGQVMGTPCYMAPEQARGEIDRVDARSDVFGLGSILCEILTGQPPYSGSTGLDVLRQAQRAELEQAWARLADLTVEPELITLTGECLAPDPGARPVDASVVARRMAEHFNNVQQRLDESRLERARAEARMREERKRRRLTMLLAAVLLFVLAAGSAAWTWYRQDRETRRLEQVTRANEARSELTNALSNVEQRLTATLGNLANLEAWRADLLAAESNLVRARAADADLTDQEAGALRGELAAAEEGARISRLELDLARALDRLERELTSYRRDTGRLNAHVAWSILTDPLARLALPIGEVAVSDAKNHVLDRPLPAQELYLLALHSLIIDNREAESEQLDWVYAWLSEIDEDPWRRQFRAALRDEHSDMVALAQTASALRQPAIIQIEATELMSRPAGLQRLAEFYEANPTSFYLSFVLGRRLQQYAREHHSNLSDADRTAMLEKAAELQRAARSLRPNHVGNLLNLGSTLDDLKRSQEALSVYKLADRLDPDNPFVINNLGMAYQALGDTPRAVAEFERARRIDPLHAYANGNLARLPLSVQQRTDLERDMHVAVQQRPDETRALMNLANFLHTQERYAEAVDFYRRALALDDTNVVIRRDFAVALAFSGEQEAALDQWEIVLKLDPDYHDAYRDYADDLKKSHYLLDAVDAYQNQLKRTPNDAVAVIHLGIAYFQLGYFSQAEKQFRAGYGLDPRHVNALFNVGNCLNRMGKGVEAEQVYRQVLKSDPHYADAYCNLGHVLQELGRYEEALTAFRQGHQEGQRLQGAWQYRSEDWVEEAEQFVRLDQEWQQGKRDFPSLSLQECNRVAQICRARGDTLRAVEMYQRILAASPGSVGTVGDDLAGCLLAEVAKRGGGSEDGDAATYLLSARDALSKYVAERANATDRKNRYQVSLQFSNLTELMKSDEFTAVRDPELQKLPESEQEPWRTFWNNVESKRNEIAPLLRRSH